MDLLEAIQARHSVRTYLNRAVEQEKLAQLEALANDLNREAGLHIQLVRDEPRAFDCMLARRMSFANVSTYLALVGPKVPQLQERCGYYGELLVLRAQQLGLNSCWVAGTYKKIPGAFEIGPQERPVCVISLGYGATQGKPHQGKSYAQVTDAGPQAPAWFASGVEAALLAPTATNQQAFSFELVGEQVRAKAGLGFLVKIDLGIAKCHFEIASGRGASVWA